MEKVGQEDGINEAWLTVGKTLFLEHIIKHHLKESCLLLNGDDQKTQEIFKERNVENYKRLIGNHRFLIIDEAQNIEEIGKALKLIQDNIKTAKIIVTGSSAFDLSNKTGEPLTGRKENYYLFPFSQEELSDIETFMQTKSNLENRLIYGSYPELSQISDNKTKEIYLNDLISSYLFKDIQNSRTMDQSISRKHISVC